MSQTKTGYASVYTGASLIMVERNSMNSIERFKPENDGLFADSQLTKEAEVYLRVARLQQQGGFEAGFVASTPGLLWPWSEEDYRPSSNPIRNLVLAGAAIAAEIDRLQRKGRA